VIQQRWILALGVLGIAVVLVYLAAALGVLRDLDNVTLALVFLIGPVAIVGVLELHNRLSRSGAGLALRTGTAFLVIAFAMFNLMLVVQQSVRIQAFDMIAAAEEETRKEMLRAVLNVTDFVQLGIDVSFDIFYCLGLILVSTVMYGQRHFGRILGIFGVVSGAALLALNLASFPGVPAESGLVDLGPLTAVWWIAVIVQLMRSDKTPRDATARAGAGGAPAPPAAGL
jgi:hypothetical protein